MSAIDRPCAFCGGRQVVPKTRHPGFRCDYCTGCGGSGREIDRVAHLLDGESESRPMKPLHRAMASTWLRSAFREPGRVAEPRSTAADALISLRLPDECWRELVEMAVFLADAENARTSTNREGVAHVEA